MQNVDQLRTELADAFQKLKAGTLDVKSASELANLAGKMVNSAKVQVEYYALRKGEPTPKITFLESEDGAK